MITYEPWVALDRTGHSTSSADPLAERLRKAGLRLTAQRLLIFKALRESPLHPTAEDLYRSVRRRVPSISRNTIYLTLAALNRAGETSEFWIDREAARFEPDSTPHDHAVCIRCKKIEDLSDPKLRRVAPPPGLEARFKVLSYRVDFFGLCKACRPLLRSKHARPHQRG